MVLNLDVRLISVSLVALGERYMERFRSLDAEAFTYFLTYNANFIAKIYDLKSFEPSY